ncbi:Leo1-like protein [Ancylostoma caninum]|uniref:Leo1-like protein n=1 Tax=Ancylostoma caninum TaxID=29170 RepID=A0A368H3Y7_ANCCA|nr:Leo1-like protein [Ancylostoma caninum]
MSDSDTGSDDNEQRNGTNANSPDSTPSHRSDTPSHRSNTPSHRSNTPSQQSNHDENSKDMPSGRDSEKSDSERSSASPRKNKKSLIDDSSEDEGARSGAEEANTTARIFGDDVSSSDSDDERGDAIKKKRQEKDSDGNQSDASRASDNSVHGIRMYPEQEEEAEKELPPTIIEATMSKVDCDFGDGIQFMKIPNFFSVALKPFDPETYEEDEDDDQVDEEGRNRLKLKAENTIRWRFAQDADGNIVKESNTKIVRWSDGSMSMLIGKEVFDVESVPIHGNMQHLFVRQGTGLVAQKIFDRKLIFRPHSTDSETHRKVTMNMAERTRKSGQVRMVAEVGLNPEQARREAVRREEEALRAAIRKETQQRRTKDRHRPNAAYLEGRPEYSDDEADNTPRGRGRGFDAPLIGASDSEDSDAGRRGNEREAEDSDEEFRRKKQQQKKKIVTSDEESD